MVHSTHHRIVVCQCMAILSMAHPQSETAERISAPHGRRAHSWTGTAEASVRESNGRTVAPKSDADSAEWENHEAEGTTDSYVPQSAGIDAWQDFILYEYYPRIPHADYSHYRSYRTCIEIKLQSASHWAIKLRRTQFQISIVSRQSVDGFPEGRVRQTGDCEDSGKFSEIYRFTDHSVWSIRPRAEHCAQTLLPDGDAGDFVRWGSNA